MKNSLLFFLIVLCGLNLSGCAGPGQSGWMLGPITRTSHTFEVTATGAAAPQGRNAAMSPTPTGLGLLMSVWKVAGGTVAFAPICRFNVSFDERLMELKYVDPNGNVFIDKLDSAQHFHFKKEVVSCEALKRFTFDPSRNWVRQVSYRR